MFQPHAVSANPLADEEEAWYRHDPWLETMPCLHAWLRDRIQQVHPTHSANALADDEDAWARS